MIGRRSFFGAAAGLLGAGRLKAVAAPAPHVLDATLRVRTGAAVAGRLVPGVLATGYGVAPDVLRYDRLTGRVAPPVPGAFGTIRGADPETGDHSQSGAAAFTVVCAPGEVDLS